MERFKNSGSLGWTAFIVTLLPPAYFYFLWFTTGLNPFVWDAGWYGSIVVNGYMFNGDIWSQNNVAFLPGYPILVYFVYTLTGLNISAAQFIASSLAFIVGAAFLHRYISDKTNELVACMAVLFIAFNPYGAYYFNGYSEPLLLSAIGLYFWAIDRGHLRTACIAASVGLVTRPHGLALLLLLYVTLFVLKYKQRGEIQSATRRAALSVCDMMPLVMLSLVLPMILSIFYYVKFSDSLLYVNALNAWSQNSWYEYDFYTYVAQSLSKLFPVPTYPILWRPGAMLPISACALLIGVWLFVRSNMLSMWFFQILIAVFGVVTGSIPDFGRHTMFLFPFAMLIPMLVSLLQESLLPNKRFILAGRTVVSIVMVGALFCLLVSIFFFSANATTQLQGKWLS